MLADTLRLRRKTLGLTQADLAARARIDTKTVSRAEKGQKVSADTLTALADALELPITTLTRDACAAERDAHGDGSWPVIRSGKNSDDTDLIASARSYLAGTSGIAILVLPDQNPRYAISAPVVVAAGGFICGFSPMVFWACYQAGLLGSEPGRPPAVLAGLMLIVCFAALVYALCEKVRRFGSDNRPAARRVYGLGPDRIHVLDFTHDDAWPRVHHREVEIDARSPVARYRLPDTVQYYVPTRQDREFLPAMPQDPQIDAILMRDPAQWGLRTTVLRPDDRVAA